MVTSYLVRDAGRDRRGLPVAGAHHVVGRGPGRGQLGGQPDAARVGGQARLDAGGPGGGFEAARPASNRSARWVARRASSRTRPASQTSSRRRAVA